jgi:NAD(P)-dependent dehydrogenase (short-subunit alcohol dehydrogenase family)
MKKIILITGATGVIGGATALEIAKSGATVVLLARNKSKLENLKKEISEKSGNKNIDVLVGDFSDIDSVKNAAKEFKHKYDQLDALINVAAIFKSKREITKDKLELMFQTNHLATFILTNELLDLLKASKPARIITVTAPSTTKVNFDDMQGEKKFSAGFLGAFGASKMMNLLFTYALSRRLEGTGVSSIAFFPGVVKSDLTKEMPAILNFIFGLMAEKPEKVAAMLCRLAIDATYQNSNGKFIKVNGKEIKSSSYSYDKDIQEKLWKISEQLSVGNS